MKDKYYWYKAHNICPKCRERPPEPGKSMCRNCLDRSNAKQKKRVKMGYGKKRYWEFRNKGVCVVCGEPVCISSGIYCGRHLLQRDNVSGRTRPIEDYTGTDGTKLIVSDKPIEAICNEDCFNCKYEDCIRP